MNLKFQGQYFLQKKNLFRYSSLLDMFYPLQIVDYLFSQELNKKVKEI